MLTASSAATCSQINAALERLELAPRRIVPLSRKETPRGVCGTYRIETRDGRLFKVRQVDTPEAARHLVTLGALLEDAFGRALAHWGCVLVEEWIAGTALTALDVEARAADAGALLGRLHARAPAAGAPAVLRTRWWIERAITDCEMLHAARRLTRAQVAALHAEIRRRDPKWTRAALAHLDFCPDNMLIDPQGRLRVIDNEHLRVAPAGFDLGRTADRWPMPESVRTRFAAGYRSAAPADVAALAMWRIVAALAGARVRLRRDAASAAGIIRQLRRFAAGDDLSEPA